MAENVTPRVKLPKTARAGEVIGIKARVTHVMESGYRKDEAGNAVPRSIVNRFTCQRGDVMVLDVAMQPMVAANPYFEFDAIAEAPGVFQFTWYDDDGAIYTDSQTVEVS